MFAVPDKFSSFVIGVFISGWSHLQIMKQVKYFRGRNEKGKSLLFRKL